MSSGVIELGGKRPNNTSGGHLCEGYTHGMNMVIENVRQLRHQADDSCPGWQQGEHTYDYSEGGCRQVRDVELAMNMGWGTPVAHQRPDPAEVEMASYKGLHLGRPADRLRAPRLLRGSPSRHRWSSSAATACGMLRGAIGAACPFCTSLDWSWQPVSGKGEIYSYQIVTQAVQPAFADWVPVPGRAGRARRAARRAVAWGHGGRDGLRAGRRQPVSDATTRRVPEAEENVAIGKRVEVCFVDLDDDMALPQFRLSDEAPEHDPWRAG